MIYLFILINLPVENVIYVYTLAFGAQWGIY